MILLYRIVEQVDIYVDLAVVERRIARRAFSGPRRGGGKGVIAH